MANWLAAAEQAAKQYGVISQAQLRTAGLSLNAVAWGLRNGKLERLLRRVYRFAGTTAGWWQRASAGVLATGPGSALSHETAAGLWGLEGFKVGLEPIHLTELTEFPSKLPDGFTVHRSAVPFRPYQQRALPVTRLARTILDLAPSLSAERLEIVIDSAHHRFRSLPRWLEEELVLRDSPRLAACARIRTILDARTGAPPQSPLETRLRRAIRARDLPPPKTQHPVSDGQGVIMAIDFAWPEERVALHGDGFWWHGRRVTFEADAEKRSRLAALDWLSLVVTKQMEKSGEWLDWLAAALERRRVQPRLLEVPRRVEKPGGEAGVLGERVIARHEEPLELEPCVTEMSQLRLF